MSNVVQFRDKEQIKRQEMCDFYLHQLRTAAFALNGNKEYICWGAKEWMMFESVYDLLEVIGDDE